MDKKEKDPPEAIVGLAGGEGEIEKNVFRNKFGKQVAFKNRERERKNPAKVTVL